MGKERIKRMNFFEDETRRAISALSAAFRWDKSPQGGKYWVKVVNNLEALLEEASA